ncbi:2-keto-4-pentenoate hydratase [Telmatospirillum sp. J64-1]|uniref:2-keto-4-pentenoate hydratase n=1 Tax=Telmatospirillum sp. J64-1 TaxID=2502183 RepID=UPI002102D288|nr:fumarylacetoacetate hydrolase family protein [Telmatospirillum sp. J64-1]
MSTMEIKRDMASLAAVVDEAARTATAIPQLTERVPDLTVEDGYAIQALSLARRLGRGERRIGVKMGLTSRAKMAQVGVDEVIWGRLTDAMRLEEGGAMSRANYVHPRIEPEIVFLMKKPLSGEVSPLEALAAVEAIAPAMEVIDSRYQNFKFALPDVVADNSSSSGFVLGNWHKPDTAIDNLGIILEADGRAVQVGSTAAILGHPLRSLVAAARLVSRWGERLNPGDIVLAGGATAAHALAPGMHVRAVYQNLGAVSLNVTE